MTLKHLQETNPSNQTDMLSLSIGSYSLFYLSTLPISQFASSACTIHQQLLKALVAHSDQR